MITRILENTIPEINNPRKAIIIIGPRQVGKTTFLMQNQQNALWFDGDEPDDREYLRNTTSAMLAARIGMNKTIVIDEAQRIENIGITIKLITDKLKDVQVYASGSSAFDLANKINEPLTGRKWEFTMLPFSFEEMSNHHGQQTEIRLLEHRLIYGYYPDVVNNPGREELILKQLAGNYLFKDILTWERIQKPDKLERLLQALAFQTGQLVSYNEIGKFTGLTNETVERYVQLLEKSFIIFRLNGFSRNLRNELSKSRKIYFYDNGLRNAIINQFNPLALRNDIGALWENFLVSERLKYLSNHYLFPNRYFWRTTDQAEIDYLEDQNGNISAFEFKFKPVRKINFPKAFVLSYSPTETHIIHKDNFHEWLCLPK